MKTRDFIANVANGNRTKEGSCASVFFDGNHIYSYGYHYPLLVKVGNRWILNDMGYSATTSKHICYAGMYADYRMDIPRGTSLTAEGLLKAVENSIRIQEERIAGLSKRAWKQKENAMDRITELTDTKNFLEGLLDQ